jgi:hypothetical protein
MHSLPMHEVLTTASVILTGCSWGQVGLAAPPCNWALLVVGEQAAASRCMGY